MGSAPVQRSWETRMGSSSRRGAYVGLGVPGVRAVRSSGSSSAALAAAAAPTPAELAPVYWYDGADASTSDWPAHGFGTTLAAGGTPTLVPSAVNGQPGVRLDTGEGYGTSSETAHAFSNGITILYVVKLGTNPGSKIQLTAGADTSYVLTDSSFGEIRLLYAGQVGGNVRYDYNAPAGSTAYIYEWTVSAAGVPSLKINGTLQTETNIVGSAGTTSEAVTQLSIGVPDQSPTVCELLAYDADDTAGLSDARTFLASKYGLTA